MEVSAQQSSQNTKMPNPNFIKLRKEVGLLEAVAIIVGSIIGSGKSLISISKLLCTHVDVLNEISKLHISGIFVSPKGVIDNVGSVGLALVVWVLCGVKAGIGALCYAELGTSLPGSGGDYHYLHEAFGSVPAFMFLWVSNLVFL
jgi:amino acid transporter